MLTMLYLWHKHDLDLLILARTPPGNSYKNLVERVMSTLNLGCQAIGLMRHESDEKNEDNIKSKFLDQFLV